MKIIERLHSLSRLPRWRVLCEGCGEEHILSCWKSEVRPTRRCRSCALVGNRRGIFRLIATMAFLSAISACGGRPFTVDPALALLGDDAEVLDANAPADRLTLGGEGGSSPDGGGNPEGSTPIEAGSEAETGLVDAHNLPDAPSNDVEVADAGAEADALEAAPPSLCCLTTAPCPDKSIPVPFPAGYGGWSGSTSGSQCMPGVPGYGYCSGTVGVCP